MLKKFIEKGSVLPSYFGDTVFLTAAEITFLKNQIKKLHKFKWPDTLIQNWIKESGKTMWDDIGNRKYWEAHQFSKPIFFRGNSLCLFSSMHFEGQGGPNYFGVLRFVENEWRQWLSISSGFLN